MLKVLKGRTLSLALGCRLYSCMSCRPIIGPILYTVLSSSSLFVVLVNDGCTTLPSCAWGKCAFPRTPALAPQMSERVYPLAFEPTYEIVRRYFEAHGYPTNTSANLIETEPYSETAFARAVGVQYRWRVQIRKMDTLNTAVLPFLYVHERGRPLRPLSPGLWPEPYRYFYHEIERDLIPATAQVGSLTPK